MLRCKTRDGFTLIEFIFIIIIISILAAIAIPKLAAVRMDAKISTKAQNIMIAANEIASYATARGEVIAKFSDMSDSIKSMVSSDEAEDTGNYQTNVKLEDINDCIIIKVDDPQKNTKILVIKYGDNTNPDCDQLRSLIDSEAFPMQLHGYLVSY